jgi:hypothetical protein
MLLSNLPVDDSSRSTSTATIYDIAIRYLPVWVVLLLGVYAAGSVIYGVAIFMNTPEAAAELDVQIAEAVKEMKKRGVIEDTKKNE